MEGRGLMWGGVCGKRAGYQRWAGPVEVAGKSGKWAVGRGLEGGVELPGNR